MNNVGALRIIALVIAALCFLAVLLGITGDVDAVKIDAAGGIATLFAIVFP